MANETLEEGGGGASCTASTAQEHTPFEVVCQTKMRPLLELNDQINILASMENDINATRIVVVGDQSHGKSSVLEAISGVDLPRGEGIQTRAPLVMQLRALSQAETSEYALIRVQNQTDNPPERISLKQVAEKTEEYTNKIVGNGKDVQDEPIELTVFRKEQLDLTLVDLPGITRVALEDQAGGDGKALETLLLNMCRRYMEPKESIILNVVSAMVDFSTSASLQLSRELDAEGRRTLLCVTKIDQHREKGLAEKILQAAHAMKLNCDNVFAVRNRSQEENDASLLLSEARVLEQAYLNGATDLMDNGELHGIGLGVEDMSRRLVEIQYVRLKQTLPQTEKQVETKLQDLQAQLELLGRNLEDETACRLEAQRLLRQLSVYLKEEERPANMPSPGFPVANGAGVSITVPNMAEFTKNNALKSKPIPLFGKEVYAHMEFNYEGTDPKLLLSIENNRRDISRLEVEVTSVWSSKSWNWNPTWQIAYNRKQNPTYSKWIARLTKENLEKIGTEKLEIVCQITPKSIAFNHVCLKSLDADFVSNIDALYDSGSFVSEGMFAHLKAESEIMPSFLSMPGSIAPSVPVFVLQRLQESLVGTVQEYVRGVISLIETRIFKAVDSVIDKEVYPNFHTLVCRVAKDAIAKHEKLSGEQVALILKLERDNVHTSNHYYMSTVQSLREHVANTKDGEDQKPDRPDYLPKAWTASKLASMSNEEQQIVDMQFQMFAYWKTMKKRLIDYVQLLARSTVVTDTMKSLNTMLNTAVVRQSSASSLMAPNEKLARSRARLNKRIKALTEAVGLLREHSGSTKSIAYQVAHA